jgi:tetratricopeptide (TPR) repeat protein
LEENAAIRKQLGEKRNAPHDERSAAYYELSLASLSLEEGRPSEAEALARKAVEQFQTEHVAGSEAKARTVLAKSFLAQGEPGKAQEAIAGAVELAGKSQSLRLDVDIASASVRAAMGNFAEAKKSLRATLAGAKKDGILRYQLEARLVLGETEMKSGHSVAGHAQLEALERDATAHGFGLIARKAAAARR